MTLQLGGLLLAFLLSGWVLSRYEWSGWIVVWSFLISVVLVSVAMIAIIIPTAMGF